MLVASSDAHHNQIIAAGLTTVPAICSMAFPGTSYRSSNRQRADTSTPPRRARKKAWASDRSPHKISASSPKLDICALMSTRPNLKSFTGSPHQHEQQPQGLRNAKQAKTDSYCLDRRYVIPQAQSSDPNQGVKTPQPT